MRAFPLLVAAVASASLLAGCGGAQAVARAPHASTTTASAPSAPASPPAVHRVTVAATRPADPPPAGVPGCPAPGRSTLVVDGRPVLRGVPAGRTPAPLVLALAGYDQTRQDLDRVSDLVARASAGGVATALLQGVGRTPAWGYQPGQTADEHFAVDVLRALRRCTDERRLVLLGFSDGGLEAMRIGCALGPQVRHLVMLSSSVMPEQGCRLPHDVRFVHGTDDPFDPYDGNDRGIVPARAAVAGWASAAGCSRATTTTTAPGVQVLTYPPCPVSLTTLLRGGHTWPDGQPSANPQAGRVFRGYDLTAVLLRLAAA